MASFIHAHFTYIPMSSASKKTIFLSSCTENILCVGSSSLSAQYTTNKLFYSVFLSALDGAIQFVDLPRISGFFKERASQIC